MFVLSVTTLPRAFQVTSCLAPYDSDIHTALGFHPELVATNVDELLLFEKLLPTTKFVGEVGLDASAQHKDSIDLQTGILIDILGACISAGGNRVISVHSRAAGKRVLDVLEHGDAAGSFVLHWFVATRRQVLRAAEMGCWFSVGPAMFDSESGRSAVEAMPRDRVLPETDGPFGKFDGRPAFPWDAWVVRERLAELWNEEVRLVEQQLRMNLAKLLTTVGRPE
jgi:TatD DNase family protein